MFSIEPLQTPDLSEKSPNRLILLPAIKGVNEIENHVHEPTM